MIRQLGMWAIALLALLINSLLGGINIHSMMRSEQALNQARDVQEEWQELLAAMIDAETGHRGFVIAGRDEFLQPYLNGRKEVLKHLTRLRDLIDPEDNQAFRLSQAEQCITVKLEEMEHSLTLFRTQGPAAARERIEVGPGREYMEQLRQVVADAFETEAGRIADCRAAVASEYRTAQFANYAGAGLGLGIVLVAIAVTRREWVRRARGAAALAQSRTELETALGVANESENRFRTLAETMPQFVRITRPDGYVEYFNSRWYDYTGSTSEASLGHAWLNFLHEDDRERAQARWKQSIATGEPVEIEYRIRRHDGTYRWFLARATAQRDEVGRIIHWLGTSTDIDDNKRLAETLERTVQERTAALLEQRTFLDTILNNISEGVVACDQQRHLLFNRAMQEMHGLPPAKITPEEWAEQYSLWEADGVTPMSGDRTPLQRALRGETVRDQEMVIRPRSGPERFVLCSGQPLVNAADRTYGAVVSMRDMTERRRYELQLLNTSALLRSSNEELEKFAYIASHDLQEPLRKIQAFADRLGKKHLDKLDGEAHDALNRILDAAGRMRRLIEDLLAFSRISTKTKPFEPVSLMDVLADVRSVFEARLEQEGGTLIVEPLPVLLGDESQLRQLFQNLIGNALKFARTGVPLRVEVRAEPFENLTAEADPPPPAGSGWRIRVTDNGIGFEQQYAERIFELFQRLHGRTDYEGTGLGLAICRKIAQRHGASITARGVPGQGATFILDWPAPPAPERTV